MATSRAESTGRRRAAAFLLALDSETAAALLSRLGERDVAALTEEMTRLGELPGSELERVMKEFTKAGGRDVYQAQPAAQALLEKYVGREKAAQIMGKSPLPSSGLPFRSLVDLDAPRVAGLLKGEHPQTIALVAMHLPPDLASALLKLFDEEQRYEIVRRMAEGEDANPDLVRRIDEQIEARVRALGAAAGTGAASTQSRFKTVAQMLTVSEPASTKAIIERLTKDRPNVANEISSLMFVFEDLLKIADRDMQKVLGELDKADLALALRACAPEVKDKLLANLSSRARDNIKEEMEMMGAKPLSEITEAQKRILQQVRALEERGDIKVNRGAQEEAL